MLIPTTVVLAEPQALVRAALRHLIEHVAGMQVVGEAGDGNELLERAVELQPQLLVTELALPQVSGLEVIRRLARHLPQVRTLVLATQHDAASVRSALRAGAGGYLCKSGDPAELEIALRAVARGDAYLSPAVSRHAIERRRGPRAEDSVILSSRQREVVKLVGRGKSTKEIAALLGLSPKTIETHRARAMQSLELRNISALVQFAVRRELADSELG